MNTPLRGTFNIDQPFLADKMNKAIERRDMDAMLDLVKQGANVNHADHNNNTALILAAIKGDAALAQTLISKGVDLERRNVHGFTALMLAVLNGRKDIVGLLIDAGADLDKKNNDHLLLDGTALDAAEKMNFDDIVQMLKEAPEIRRRAIEEAAARDKAIILKRQTIKGKAQQQKLKIKPAP